MNQNNEISQKIINIQACAQLDFGLFCRVMEPKSETLKSLLNSFHGKILVKKLNDFGLTIFIIAHRESTLKYCDKIYKL